MKLYQVQTNPLKSEEHMMKRILGAVAVAGLIASVGCTSINSSDAGSMTVYPKTVGPTDNYRPIYSVDQTKRVSGDAKVNVLFGIFTWGDDSAFADNANIFHSTGFFGWVANILPNAKQRSAQAAFYKACKNAKCDAVVAARYEITTEDYFFFKKCSVEIKGYPAVQTGLETVKPFPYYISPEGKLIVLDKFVTPVKLADERIATQKSCFLF